MSRRRPDAHVRVRGLVFRNVTKTDGSRRVVSLPTFLVNMLTTQLDGIPADPNALVFTAPGCGPVRHEQFPRRVFVPAVKGLALPYPSGACGAGSPTRTANPSTGPSPLAQQCRCPPGGKGRAPLA